MKHSKGSWCGVWFPRVASGMGAAFTEESSEVRLCSSGDSMGERGRNGDGLEGKASKKVGVRKS